MKRPSFTLMEFLIVLAIMGILAHFITFGSCYLFQIPFYFLFGWLWGLSRFLSNLISDPTGLVGGSVLFLILSFTLHLLGRRFNPESDKKWTFRKSLSCSGFAIVLIVLGNSVSLLSLETGDLLLSGKSMLDIQWDYGVSVRRGQSRNYLIQNSFGVLSAADPGKERFIYGGTMLKSGEPGHGWMTQILPFIDLQALYEKIDLEKPWDHPDNAEYFKLKPGYTANSHYFDKLDPMKQYDAKGFRRTDFTANERVLTVGSPFRLDRIEDGASNTILLGEARENLAPWGSPLNSRDPALGVNRSPFGFGGLAPEGRFPSGCFVTFCDGSAKFLSSEINPKILHALATPNGGEKTVEIP